MNNTIPSRRRRVPLTVAAVALVLAAAAQGQPAAVQSIPIDGPHDDNLAVAVDQATGKLRAANAAEIQQLQAARAQSQRLRALSASARPTGTLQRAHASGARGARLNDDFMHFSTVTVEGGRLVTSCLHANEREATIAHGLGVPRLDRVDHKNALPTE